MEHRTPNRTFYRLITAALALLLAAAACNLPGQAQGGPTSDPRGPIDTAAAQTLEALRTEVASQSTTDAPGSGKATATARPIPTLKPSATPQSQDATATTAPKPPAATSTNTAVPTPCDAAGFISDVTVPDGTLIPAGQEFTKTWRLRNNGTCTWTEEYAVVFDKGESLGAPAAQKLGKAVAPGDTVDVSVVMRAPATNGSFRGDWKLRNAAGILFGIGANNKSFYVEIKVAQVTPASGSYDFTANYCAAEWAGGDKSIACPGKSGDSAGSVQYVENPVLETGSKDDEPALVMNPPHADGGVIRAKFPQYKVEGGDHFRALFMCGFSATACDARFELSYQLEDGSTVSLGTWTEKYDNNYTSIDVDLSALEGKLVRFILTVKANNNGKDSSTLLLHPRID